MPKHDSPFGPTGEFPKGRMCADDEGELQIGIWADEHGRVIINFGAPAEWIGLEREYAVEFARLLLKKAGATKVEVEF